MDHDEAQKTDPKRAVFRRLDTLADMDRLYNLMDRLGDQNNNRGWSDDVEKCHRVKTWTVIERNKILDDIISSMFSAGEWSIPLTLMTSK